MFIALPLSLQCAEPEGNRPSVKRDGQGLPLREIRAFAQAYRQIKAHYVSETDDKALFEAAIAGMAASLDSHSVYLDAKQYARFKQDSEGDFAGIGISLEDDEAGLRVVAVVTQSPAAIAGITEGDIILAVDGKSMKYVAAEDAISEIVGVEGSQVRLTVATVSGQQKAYTLTRAVIHRPSVFAERLPHHIGYLRIESFNFETTREFECALNDLRKQSIGNGLIIDLRDNPGGIIDSAIAVADRFIEQGLIIRAIGRTQDMDQQWLAHQPHTDRTTPLMLLINGNTGSAAEILTVALKGHQRALLVGQKTWGKGSIQSIYELNNETAIKLTSAYYVGPGDVKIDNVGISPDIRVTAHEAGDEIVSAGSGSDSDSASASELDLEQLLADPYVSTAYNHLRQSHPTHLSKAKSNQ